MPDDYKGEERRGSPPDQAKIYHSLGRIESKLDSVIDQGEDHETRVRALEKFRNIATGAAGLITTTWAAAWAYIKSGGNT